MSDTDNNLAARIFLRPIGVSLPMGMAGLAIASFVNSGLELHWVQPSQTLEVGVILAAVPFALQLIACVFSYLARDGAAGATLGILAATWLALGARPHHGAESGGQRCARPDAVGLWRLGGAVCGGRWNRQAVPALVFLAAALRFELAGIYQLSASSPWESASASSGSS